MKILTQNKRSVILSDNTLKIVIEREENQAPKIMAYHDNGSKSLLGVYMPREAERVLEAIALSTGPLFKMPLSERYSGGHSLSKTDINKITKNLIVSDHAKCRMAERGLVDLAESKHMSHEDFKKVAVNAINKNVCAFWGNDAQAIIAVDANHYFVIKYDYDTSSNGYIILSYIEEKTKNIFDIKKDC